MSVLDELKRQRRLIIRSSCGHEFRAADAGLFDATRTLPAQASARLEALRAEIAELRVELKRRQKNATTHAKVVSKAVNIGKVVEKLAPSLPGFPIRSAECRALFEPIDYVVFRGLASGAIEFVEFVDVKSGTARLSEAQRDVKCSVEAGKVSLFVGADANEEAA